MFKFNLNTNEKVLNIYRQSETVLFKTVLIIFICNYFPWYFIFQYDLVNKFSRLLLFWTFLIIIYAINKYLLWLLNVYIITNQRIIAVQYINLFTKIVLETPIDRILNVSYEVRGVWNTLIKCGSVISQVKGLTEPIIFKNISEPAIIKDYIWDIHLKQKQTQYVK